MACRNADGKEIHKPIEEIEVGDEVLSYDEETGEQGYKPVVRLFRNQTKEWYHVFVDGEEIRCTGEHPFYVKGKGFIPAKELKSGDKCLLSTGEDVTIEKVEVEALTEAETTYNFEVADFHTYYVTEKDVLVHNVCKGKNKLKPNPEAQGAHTVFKRDPVTGKITNYATYEPNPMNPSGFDEVLRFDGIGKAHAGVPTPHVHTSQGVRPALPWEIPR